MDFIFRALTFTLIVYNNLLLNTLSCRNVRELANFFTMLSLGQTSASFQRLNQCRQFVGHCHYETQLRPAENRVTDDLQWFNFSARCSDVHVNTTVSWGTVTSLLGFRFNLKSTSEHTQQW